VHLSDGSIAADQMSGPRHNIYPRKFTLMVLLQCEIGLRLSVFHIGSIERIPYDYAPMLP